MQISKILFFSFLYLLSVAGNAQLKHEVMEQVKEMKNEKDPAKNVATLQKIKKENHLSESKDAETIDLMKGFVAMSYLNAGNHTQFEKYVFEMKNKFNQTSYLTAAASDLIRAKKDLPYAKELALRALELYSSYKDDPSARPASISKDDWSRFMKFAVYPYNDTYAAALFANGDYKNALKYQVMAFNSKPEEGMPSSIERYAQLLEQNGQKDSAYNLLLSMAMTGRSTAAMDVQLKKLYVNKKGSEKDFDALMKKVETSVQAVLKKKFSKKALNYKVPDFTLTDLNGLQVSLSDFKGKIVVIDFWATWCLPCRASFPAMIKVMKNHPEIVFLYIATREDGDDPVNQVKKFLLDNSYPFYVLMDDVSDSSTNSYKALSIFKPQGIPAKIIIDKKGMQQFMTTGFTSENELINELEAMISIASEN